MSLFQPTNILPDVLNGTGNGTVDVTEDLIISWQINGDSPMTGYSISIRENTTSSTQLYTTSATLGTPFYGKDYNGDVQRYSVTISASALSAAGISNGNAYKIIITQYWTEGSTQKSVAQSSASIFYTRATPTVTITSVGTLDSCKNTFTGTYSQANGDMLRWVQWTLYDADDMDNPLSETGQIYTQQLAFNYDGFLNGKSYVVEVTVESELGIQATDSTAFSVSWEVVTFQGSAEAAKLNNQSSAVRVEWSGIRYINGAPSTAGSYSISNGMLSLKGAANSISWDNINGQVLSLDAPWYLLFSAQLQSADSTLFVLKDATAGGDIVCAYDFAARTLSLKSDDEYIDESISYVNGEDTLTIIVTPAEWYVRRYGYKDGLTPSTALTPTTTLTPSAGVKGATFSGSIAISYTQAAITAVQIYGTQKTDYVQVVNGTITAEIINTVYTRGAYVPETQSATLTPGTVFLADFVAGLDAGSFSIGSDTIQGWAVYRHAEAESISEHIANVDMDQSILLDYTAGNGQGAYSYSVYPIGSTDEHEIYLTNALESNAVSPCFWNWSILECTQDSSDKKLYHATDEYVFRNNVVSGTISNNNSPNVIKNFTQYPTVQLSNSQYQSGTLSGLIGQTTYLSYVVQPGDALEKIAWRFSTTISEILASNSRLSEDALESGMVLKILLSSGYGSYWDDRKLRDKIWGLSTTTKHLFLKGRKGDLMKIQIAGAITMSHNDTTVKQEVKADIPWVEVGSTEGVRIIGQGY